jgi:hypothetical protein
MFHYLLIFNLSISSMVFTFFGNLVGWRCLVSTRKHFIIVGENFFLCDVVSIDFSRVVSNLKHISILVLSTMKDYKVGIDN